MGAGHRLASLLIVGALISASGAALAQADVKSAALAGAMFELKGKDSNAILPDPAVLRGSLANGLRYAVIRNNKPAGGAAIRLVIGAGSFHEEPGERGAAHFVEHLAFEPGEPGTNYIGHFQAAGVP